MKLTRKEAKELAIKIECANNCCQEWDPWMRVLVARLNAFADASSKDWAEHSL